MALTGRRLAWVVCAVLAALLAGAWAAKRYAQYTHAQYLLSLKQVAPWKAGFDSPLESRFAVAPPRLIERINADNLENGIAQRAHPSAPSSEFMRDLGAAIATLPPEVKRGVAHKLAGIYLADNFSGSGMAEMLYDAGGRPAAGLVVLDGSLLEKRSANDWATWKESQPFYQDGSHWTLRAQIEEPREDSRVRAIQYILLHELGHIVSINTDLGPDWELRGRPVPAAALYPFIGLGWQATPEGAYAPLARNDFRLRGEIGYYERGGRLPASAMAAAYQQLQSTNFASLYGATNPWDDFAEAFATYVHSELMHRPYVVRLYRDDVLQATYGPCWAQARCDAKRAHVRRALGLEADPVPAPKF